MMQLSKVFHKNHQHPPRYTPFSNSQPLMTSSYSGDIIRVKFQIVCNTDDVYLKELNVMTLTMTFLTGESQQTSLTS